MLLTANEGRFCQSHGYAYVAVDCRGRGKSEGVWNGFANDVPDTHDVIEWVAAQRWCDEKVGTTGISYMGWVPWAGASEYPPHLRAMVSISAAGRWQQEIPYTNGIFQLYFAWWPHGTRSRIDESCRRQQIDWEEALRRLPLIGASANPRVFVAGGHGMWGIALGPTTGRLLAEQIVTGTRPRALRAFSPLR